MFLKKAIKLSSEISETVISSHPSDNQTWLYSHFQTEWLFILVVYRIITSSNTSCLEAHAGFFILLMKGIFDPYVLWPFDKKFIFELVMSVNTRDFTVYASNSTDFLTVLW